MQVLIVSHVAPLRRALRSTLERAQHRTTVAETLDEALKILSVNLSIDVVLTEWNLTTGTAMELQVRCQQLDRLADTLPSTALPHFIVLATPTVNGTHSEGRGITQEIQKFGFTDILEKPIDHTRVLQRLLAIGRERAVLAKPPTTSQAAAVSSSMAASAPDSPAWIDRVQQLEQIIANLTSSIRNHDLQLQEVQLKLQRMA